MIPCSYRFLTRISLWLSSSTYCISTSLSCFILLAWCKNFCRSSFRLVSNSFTSSISCRVLFLFEDSFIMSADLPLEAIGVRKYGTLTAEVLAVAQSFCKFWSHINVQMSAQFYLHLSCFHTIVDHFLNAVWIESEHYIAQPLPVNMNPVSCIR